MAHAVSEGQVHLGTHAGVLTIFLRLEEGKSSGESGKFSAA